MTGPDLIPVVLDENCDRRQWVGFGCSVDQEAAVQPHQRLKGGFPFHFRPTPGKRPTAAKADLQK